MKSLLKKNTTARRTKIGLGTSLTIAIAITTASPAAAQVGISTLNATYQNGTPSSYPTTVADPCNITSNGGYPSGCNSNINMQFGDGATNDLVLSGFTVGTDNYSLVQLADDVKFRRIDNAGVKGERQLVFFEYNSGDKIRSSYTNTMAGAMLGTVINRGIDNGFSNENGDVASNNVERIDYIISAGLPVPATSSGDIGFLVLERNGNDPFQIAAITSLDANGKPNGFGPLRKVGTPTWGKSSFNLKTAVMRREENETAFRPSHLVGSQTISGVYTSIASLGVNPGQTVYGYALFPNDINASNDLVNLTDFPTNTSGASGAGGLDLMAGGGIFMKDGLTTVEGILYEDTDGDNNLGGSEPKLPAGITVRLLDNNNQQIATATTDSNGAYKFIGIADGNYTIQVDTTDSDIPDEYTLGTANDIEINVAGAAVTEQNFGFDKAATTFDISGTVFEDYDSGTASNDGNNNLDTNENGISDITVQLFQDSNSNGTYDEGTDTQVGTDAVTGTDGTYNFNGLANGTYFVKVDDRDTDLNSRSYGGTDNPIKVLVANNNQTADFPFDEVNYEISPDAGKVIINEVLYNENGTSAAANDEFIEIYNASTSAVDLTGWKLMDGNIIANDTDDTGSITGSSSPYEFPSGTTLQPGEYAVIWIGDETNTPDRQATGAAFEAWLGNAPKLNNTGDDIWLYDPDSKIVDYVAYGSGDAINTPPPTSFNLWESTHQSALAGASDGQSISLTKNGLDDNTSACWEPTTSANAQTQGCANYLPTIDSDDTASRVTSAGANNNGVPKVVLVKRITAINNQTTNPNDGTLLLNSSDNDNTSDDDDNPKWPDNYLKGAINAGKVKPGDEIEYTVYFLSTGNVPARNVLFCDRVPATVTFIPNSFNGEINQATGGLQSADRGILWEYKDTQESLSNVQDGDLGQYFAARNEPSTVYPNIQCDGTNTNGAIVVNLQDVDNSTNPLGNLPNATDPGTPNTSYGFVRFRARVK